MAREGGQPGNNNAAKGRRMARIFERICAEEEYKRITAGINIQLDRFAEGDLKAGEFVRDTTDGKPAQSVTLASDPDHPLKIEQVIVDPTS
jgi:hypothetical protein